MAPYTDAFWVFDDNNTPCQCCSAIEAMENGFWNCKERRWAVVDSYFPLEHTAETCDGSCGNLFHATHISELLCAELSGYGWGDVQYGWENDAYARLSPEEKATRLAADAAEKAEEERLKPLLAEHHAQVDRMRRCRQIANEKRNKGRKEVAPCRSLYDYQREGGCQSLSICTECWAHEFTDSLSSEIVDEKTGRFKEMAEKLGIRHAMNDKECGIFRLKDGKYVLKWMPHVCYMSHPGESTWNPEWTQNRKAGVVSRGSNHSGPNQHGPNPRESNPRNNGNELIRNWRGSNQNGSNQNGSNHRGSNQQQAQPHQQTNKPSNNRFANLESAW